MRRRRSRSTTRNFRALALGMVLLCARAVAQQTTTQPAVDFAAAVAAAQAWVTKPAGDELIPAFRPALELHYRTYAQPRPLRVWIARVDLAAPGLRFALTEPAAADSPGGHTETLCANTLEFARQRGVQLAINTSAFGPFRGAAGEPMDVVGLAAVRGEKYSDPDERFGALYISRDGRVSLKGPPLDTADLWHVVPGFRMLLDDRQVAVRPEVAASKFGGVNPRTAVGVDEAGRTLWVVVADGRREGLSEGITLVELACLFQSLGAWDALNLDGGGSTTLVLENAAGGHDVINTPSGRGEPYALRQVANNLGLYLPGPPSPPAQAQPQSLTDAVIRLVAGDGPRAVHSYRYDDQEVFAVDPRVPGGAGATLNALLQAYCRQTHGQALADVRGRWFLDWPHERFAAFQQIWGGVWQPPATELFAPESRPALEAQRACLALTWAGLAQPVSHWRFFERGDFVQLWRADGSTHSAIYWGRDEDDDGRPRLWYWSSPPDARYIHPQLPGMPPRQGAYGVFWEYVGDELDPARLCGVRLGGTAASK